MRLSPRKHVSNFLCLASLVLAGCLGKNQRVENPVELEHERYNEIKFPEDDEFDDLPEAGDTGWVEGEVEE